MRLTRAKLEHRHWGLLGMRYTVSEDGDPEFVDHGLQLYAACAAPSTSCGARDDPASAPEDGFLAVWRKVVGVLGDNHLRHESNCRHALVDHLGGHRNLGQRMALRARPRASNMALDVEHAENVVKLLGLVDALERAAALAGGRPAFVMYIDARQVCQHRRAARLLAVAGGRSSSVLLQWPPGWHQAFLPDGWPARRRASRCS